MSNKSEVTFRVSSPGEGENGEINFTNHPLDYELALTDDPEKDKHVMRLRGLVTHLLGDRFSARYVHEKFSPSKQIAEKLLTAYPEEAKLREVAEDFLLGIELENGAAKRKKYEAVLDELCEKLYHSES